MAIDSTSTWAQIEAEYLDTAGYLISESSSEALRHAKAIRYMLLKLPSTSIKGSNTVSYSMSLLSTELKKADEYAVATRNAGGRVIRPKFNNMRGFG